MKESTPSELFRLDGRTALITGATRGLGLEMARAFAAQGARIAVSSRKEDACREVADLIEEEFQTEAIALPCNVSKWEECDRLIDAVYDTWGHINILVNNAGMSPLYPSLSEVTESLFDKVLGVNFKGPFRLSSVIGEHMESKGGGTILNISSVAATNPDPGALPYAAAKAALNTLTIGLAKAYGPLVRVNGILAGPFYTDVTQQWDLERFDAWAREAIALQRGGRPEEIVGAALFLASDASSYCTGSLLSVDGGYT